MRRGVAFEVFGAGQQCGRYLSFFYVRWQMVERYAGWLMPQDETLKYEKKL